jgi:DNA-binding response OmpR family regulator
VLKSRLLIVEDDPGARLGVRTYLETYGYEIHETDTIAGALEKLTTEVADLVLLDYALPDGTALDLLRQLKLAGIEVPVVAMDTDRSSSPSRPS